MKRSMLKLLNIKPKFSINKIIGCFLLLIIFGGNYCFSQLFTKEATTSNIDSIVNAVFGSPNVQISNINFIGEHYPIGAPYATIKDIGTFNSMNSTVGFDEGLILTGGYLAPPYGLGQPSSVNVGFWKMTNGDSLLDAIIYPYKTVQAAVIEFDFIPNGDSIKFNYVFASDEYPHQICSNDFDVFAFHISGPGIVGNENIALIPGTNFPVGINTVNDTSTTPYWSNFDLNICPTIDYSQYYIDHAGNQTFVFNGSTTVLTAKAATIPCQTYHLRLAIAEGRNSGESSAVFLESNSFNSEPISIESDISYGSGDTLLYENCGQAKIIIKRTYNIIQPKSYSISISGSATNGLDYNYISNSISMVSGQFADTLFIIPLADNINDNFEDIIITVSDTLCNGEYFETSKRLVIHEKPNYSVHISPEEGFICDKTEFTSVISGAIPPLSYDWNNGLSNDSIFIYFPDFHSSYVYQPVWLSTVDACGNTAKDSTTFIFSQKPTADFTYNPTQIDLLNSIIQLKDKSSNDVSNWSWFFNDDNTNEFIKSPIHHYKISGDYLIDLKVSNQFNCVDSISKTIRVFDIPVLYIPNSFSPNNDGVNDVLTVKGSEISEFKINIFNRWGELVFHSDSIFNSWTGENANVGTYTYTIKVKYNNDQYYTKNGSVLLIK